MNQELRLEGKNPFYDYQLPMAIIRPGQAIVGPCAELSTPAVLILDSRGRQGKRYGVQISKALSRTSRTLAESKYLSTFK